MEVLGEVLYIFFSNDVQKNIGCNLLKKSNIYNLFKNK